MALLYHKVNERYEYYQFQQNQAGLPHKSIMVTMFECLIQRIDDHPYRQKSIIQTFHSIPYCSFMQRAFTREEWDEWTYELRQLSQYLDPQQL